MILTIVFMVIALIDSIKDKNFIWSAVLLLVSIAIAFFSLHFLFGIGTLLIYIIFGNKHKMRLDK